jgi:hypothetical protein
MSYVLIVLMLNSVWYQASANSPRSQPAPTVTMQEFDSEKACLFAGNAILRRAGEAAGHLRAVCVPKGDRK